MTDQIKALPGKTGFYYENLVTGERAAYHEEERMMAASVIKLFVMTEAFTRFEEGTLSPDRIIRMRREAVSYTHLDVYKSQVW